jgi:hypothetical protein
MKNTKTLIFDTNKYCFVDYGLGLGKQPAVLYKDTEYEVTDFKVENRILSFELWDDDGFIGKYWFNEITFVIETYMGDGNDLIHEWHSVKEALESGRFDYLIENGDYTEKQLTSCETVEELVQLVKYPFYCCK